MTIERKQRSSLAVGIWPASDAGGRITPVRFRHPGCRRIPCNAGISQRIVVYTRYIGHIGIPSQRLGMTKTYMYVPYPMSGCLDHHGLHTYISTYMYVMWQIPNLGVSGHICEVPCVHLHIVEDSSKL